MEITVTLVIVAITVLVSFAAFNNEELKDQLIFSPYQAKHQNEWWRAITHGFIHADHMHLLFNMYVLYWAGNRVEFIFQGAFGNINGSIYYLGLYVGGLVFATLPSLRKHSDSPVYRSLGASGAVSAVLFAFIILRPNTELLVLLVIPMPAFIFGGLYLAFETYSNKNGRSNIAHDAHIAGALFGIIYVVAIDFNNFTNFISQIGF